MSEELEILASEISGKVYGATDLFESFEGKLESKGHYIRQYAAIWAALLFVLNWKDKEEAKRVMEKYKDKLVMMEGVFASIHILKEGK